MQVLREGGPLLLLCGVVLLLAGFLLDQMKALQLFRTHSALRVLVPVLLGLKCNLESTLASRLGSAHHMKLLRGQGGDIIIRSNNAVVVLQALVVGFVSPVVLALLEAPFGLFSLGSLSDCLLLFATSAATAAGTCFAVAQVVIISVRHAAKRDMDPDNIAGTIAASAGDCTAIVMYGP
jgi:cation transporter-like permease